ncbi:MAG: branched-chain amino acid ABC transporter permease [Verrucomicrobiae bacterium]|nr:branched-chain amino acid ABC transporter permease [Verrucomicrobiae bacterium]
MGKTRIVAGLALLVALLTAPFLWLRLNYDYNNGTLVAETSAHNAANFFSGLWPVLGFVAIFFVLRLIAKQWPAPFRAGGDRLRTFAGFASRPFAEWVLLAVALALAFVLPGRHVSSGFFVALYMILALGLNVTVGFAGLLVLGYAGFYSLGGYAFALSARAFPWMTWWMALPGVFVVGAIAGWLVGLPCLRLRGDYLAIVTLGFSEGFRELMRNLVQTGGDKGIIVPAQAKILPLGSMSSLQVAYCVAILGVFATVALIRRLYDSRVGRAWIAIREDEIAAASMGIPVVRLKLQAFALSAGVAAVAGCITIGFTGFIDPGALGTFENSALIVAMVILGGIGSIGGALLGAALLYLIPAELRNYYASAADYRLLLFGAIMVVMMLYRPQGLLGSKRHQLEIQGD